MTCRIIDISTPIEIEVIRVAQGLGLTLAEIDDALGGLPDARTPTRRDWERLSKLWRRRLDARIAELEGLRDKLTSCIGCGCLSLKSCALYNTGDRAAEHGPGPRYLLGDSPDVESSSEPRRTGAIRDSGMRC